MILPVYDQVGTVAAVLRAALQEKPSVIVVDDGSRDGSAQAIADVMNARRAAAHDDEPTPERGASPPPRLQIVTLPKNRGKGAALRTGFDAARAAGFTHAVTLDTDGQHDPADIPILLAAARMAPAALVLGTRQLAPVAQSPAAQDPAADDPSADSPRTRRRWLKSRVLRFHSNVWVWLATGGQWISDTQTGFRVYPLAALAGSPPRGDRYEFELEAIIRLARRGVPIREAPIRVRYPPGTGSHFRPVRDLLRCGAALLRVLFGG